MTIHRRFGPARGMLLAAMLAGAAPAAQADWWNKAKELFGSSDSESQQEQELSRDQIGSGLKEALRVGTETVVAQLGRTDGFNADPAIRIPLPDSLGKVQSMLDKVGMGSALDDLELRLNRAAELATPRAKSLFIQAVNDMTLEDVMRIYKGPDDAATRYFEAAMSEPLAAEMHPVVDESLADAGAMRVYESVMDTYSALPFAPEVDADLTGYVVQKGMDGIFHYIALEEAAIRNDPMKRSTELLKTVFGK